MTPSSKRVSWLLFVGVAGLALMTHWATSISPVAAQQGTQRWPAPAGPVDEATVERARDIYRGGRAAVENENLESGLGMFEESYELSGAWMALFAVGHTLNDLGRHDEAALALEQLLNDHGDVAEDFRVEARTILQQIGARQAWLSLSDLPRSPTVILDGSPMRDTGERPLVLPTSPGQHALNITVDGFEPFEWQGFATGGETTSVLVRSIELEDDSGSIFESPWFWLLGAAVIAGGVVVAVLLMQVKRYDQADLDDPSTAGSRTPFVLVLP